MLTFKYFDAATSILYGVEAIHIVKKEQVDLRDQSVQNQKEIQPLIVWVCSIRYDSIRKLCVLLFFILFLHQNSKNYW